MDSIRIASMAPRQGVGAVPIQGSECPWIQGCSKEPVADPASSFPVEIVVGHDAGALNAAQSFARAQGLPITEVDAESRTVKMQCTAAQASKAFGVQLGQYKTANGETYRGYEGRIMLPPALAGKVEGVLGLDDHPVAQPRFVLSRDGDGFTPPQIAAHYNFPRGLTGQGQTIGIIELGGGYKPADLQAYFKELGIAQPSVTDVGVDFGRNSPTGNANGPDAEVCLDVDVAGAVAPGAHIRMYFAPNLSIGFADAIKRAVKECNTVSISWGSPEDSWSGMMRNIMNNAIADGASRGVNVFSAAGDRGSGDGEKGNHVDFPASSPYGIGCGGTRLDGQEVVWNDPGGGATGGGVSTIYPLPGFQANAHVPANGRGVPDVAGDASPGTGYLVRVDGQEFPVGGTSAVAPLWAGLTAVLGQGVGHPLGWLPPFLYSHPEAFHDVTSGNNGAFSAGPGWDAATGQGSPDGEKLLASLRG